MRPDILLDASPVCSPLTGVIDRFGGEVLAIRSLLSLTWEEVLARFLPAPVFAQRLEQLRTERDVTVFAALPLPDVNHHAIAVDIVDLQRYQFCTPHACGVKRHQQGAMQESRCGINHPSDFVLAEDDRQSLRRFRIP